MKTYHSTSTQQTKEIAAEVAAGLCGSDVVCLQGDLGAGKTTFAQGLLVALGAHRPYPSPTFTIVNSYDVEEDNEKNTKNITTVHHMDAYRIEDKDVEGIGWDAMISDKNAIIILEWPERITDAVPQNAKTIYFTAPDESTRELRCEGF